MRSSILGKNAFFVFVIAVISIMAWSLLDNYSNYFDQVNAEYKEKKVLDLSKPVSVDYLTGFLLQKGYFENDEDASFIAKAISKRISEGKSIDDIKDFQKKAWCLTIDEIESSNSPFFKKKLMALRAKNSIPDSLSTPKLTPNGESLGSICAYVFERKDYSNAFSEIIDKITKKDKIPCEGVTVRLSEHGFDHLANSGVTDSIIGYAKTDTDGKIVFRGLDPQKSYSILPISDKFNYGYAKGTLGGSLSSLAKDGNLKIESPFIQRPLTIPMFSYSVLNKMKKEHSVIVRSVEAFKKSFVGDIASVLFAWIALYLILSIVGVRMNIVFENSIITCLTFLTCTSLIMMYSMTDPLIDTLRGGDTATGIKVGVIIIAILFFINIISFYQGKYRISFDWLSNKFSCVPRGISYVLVALLLTALLFTPIGKEVGGMKVNLDMGIKFQPSEIAKYLVVIFMAAFFCVHENAIIKFSQKGNVELFLNKLKYMGAIILGLISLIILYMLLGDMGPGLVIATTFIILYSAVKSKISTLDGKNWSYTDFWASDIMLLFVGVVSFCVMLYVGASLGVSWLFAFSWFVIWILGGILLKKQVYESPIMFNLIISLFVYGGSLFNLLSNIPFLEKLQSIGERLDSRTQMCLNTWGELGLGESPMQAGENSQVAEGLWALASGGLKGQGIGEGFPDRIPAFHTDMILSSIGENLGFLFLFAIVVVLSFLLKRSLNAGYRTGNQFGLFLSMGIVIVTATQFFIIAFGSTGIIPLTGVTVPFLSYGKVSLILNLAAFGLILSMSKRTKAQSGTGAMPFTTKDYKYTVSSISLIYIFLSCGVCLTYFNYQFVNRDNILVRPLFVTNNTGAPVIEYNPRIQILTDLLHSGNIYDRNGVLLATNNADTLHSHKGDYEECSLNIDKVLSSGKKRLYPFGAHTLFMTGDLNEQFLSENYGYMADVRHLSYLRGFDNQKYDEQGNPIKLTLVSSKYSYSPFLPESEYVSDDSYSLRDYSILLPLLKEGIKNNDRVDEINNRISSFWHSNDINPKDIHLTIDAKLQYSIQEEMTRYVEKNYNTPGWNRLRISAVILDADNGDLLTSANYPLPDISTIKENNVIYSDRNKGKNWKAYTDMDLGLKYPTAPGSTAKVMSALAGIKKEGKQATEHIYKVDSLERIEVFRNGDGEPTGNVTMQDAIVISSNCYFVNLVNNVNLYKNLSDLYKTVGVQCNFRNEDGKAVHLLPYSLFYTENDKLYRKWDALFNSSAAKALSKFEKYDSHRKNPKFKKAEEKYRKMNDTEWALAWGQGIIEATPLAMSRVASMVVQSGKLTKTNFIKANDEEKSALGLDVSTPVFSYIDKHNYEAVPILASYMEKQASQYDIGKPYKNMIGGKTGTPERIYDVRNRKVIIKNDGWYICYIKDCKINGKQHNIALAVRMERLQSGLSGRAMDLVRNVVLPQLAKYNYIQYKD